MADIFRVLGQYAGTTTTGIVVYNVPAGTTTTISTITVCNNTTNLQTFKMWVVPSGGLAGGTTGIALPAVTSGSYIFYDQQVEPNSTFACTFGITLGTDASIVASTSSTSMSINVFGVEVT
jgi:hypothetical protein